MTLPATVTALADFAHIPPGGTELVHHIDEVEIPIADPRRCQHQDTICAECAPRVEIPAPVRRTPSLGSRTSRQSQNLKTVPAKTFIRTRANHWMLRQRHIGPAHPTAMQSTEHRGTEGAISTARAGRICMPRRT
ncbi:hypothetical protein DFR74_11624 [Nocardia puris]|uniref:Uncharacterized protein n=1 Tax=Nocardia puris TaxID=208602 RepID=A0A366D326_9NOCA|nr:hypothetical protein DFR74_11624 [Nocardia puris]